MNHPGVPSRGLGDGGSGTGGMSEQEQKIVKGVSFIHVPLPSYSAYQVATADECSNGELRRQNRGFWRYGLRIRWLDRSIYVKCTLCLTSLCCDAWLNKFLTKDEL